MDYWYEIIGEGIPVVLLHGFTGSSATWNNLIDSQPEGFQFIVVDLPGHGRTKGNIIKTMESCCRDLYQLLQNLNLAKFFLVGYSMGGRTALTYARYFPETIQGLILESASPGLDNDDDCETRRKNDDALAKRIEVEGVEAFVNYWENIALFSTQKSLTLEKQAEIRRERLSHTDEGLALSLRGMGTGSQTSNWKVLEKLTFPVLLLVGSLDSKFVMINKKMLSLLPNAELEICEEAGHAIHIEKSETFTNQLVAFAKSHAS